MTPTDIVTARSAALALYARQWVDAATADDVVQDVLVAAWSVKPIPHDPAAWAFAAVRNRAITASRATARRRRHEKTAAENRSDWFEPSTADSIDAGTAEAALRALPEPLREAVVLRFWGDLGFAAIAAVVGCSVATAHNRYTSAIAALREKLETPCPTNSKTD
jgi:RNA polymerase sigma factor (sigma-70 family)